MSIYSEIILHHYKHPSNYGSLEHPDLKATAVNTVCGDKVAITIKKKHDKIVDIKFEGSGCAISIASASLLSEKAKGMKIVDLQKLDRADIVKLLGIELSASRLKCALLPLEALKKAVL